MRRVALNQLTPDMCLAKPIYQGNRLILPEGTNNLIRYVTNLNNLGIYSLYINDEYSDEIEITDGISDLTRTRCKLALHDVFKSMRQQGIYDSTYINDTISTLLDELLQREDILVSLSDIGTKDDSTLIHSVNSTVLSLLVGKQLHLNNEQLLELAEGSLLHDIGKTLLDSDTLLKSTPLSKEEFEHIRSHPELGYNLLKCNPNMSEISRLIALQHHERLDGTGYPFGLKGDEIHLYSKITAITDMYDALTAERCYRSSMSNFKAYQILIEQSSTKLDEKLLKLFLTNVAIYPNGVMVQLSDGTRGIIKSQNINNPFRPIIRIIDDFHQEDVILYDLNLLEKPDIKIIEK